MTIRSTHLPYASCWGFGVFYKHTRLTKKLREHGRAAPAEILSMRTEGHGQSAKLSADDDLTAGWTDCRLELRVMPEGGTPFETTVRTRLNTFKYKGDRVPVLYDPDDHDKVVVDHEADAQETMERQAAQREAQGDLATEAADFAESARAFREQSEGLREATEKLASLARARTSGDQAEVERLKGELQQRAAGPAGPDPDRLERLERLAALHDRGVLSDAEFAAEKAKLLGAE